MRILIISLPRTGSNSLMKKYSSKYKLDMYGEPFNERHLLPSDWITSDNVIVTTKLTQCPENVKNSVKYWYEQSKSFDKVILLSRKDLYDCAKSFSFLLDKRNEGYKYNAYYVWEETPSLNNNYKNLQSEHKKLELISEKLNISVIYYEDIFDINSKDRLRKNNKEIL